MSFDTTFWQLLQLFLTLTSWTIIFLPFHQLVHRLWAGAHITWPWHGLELGLVEFVQVVLQLLTALAVLHTQAVWWSAARQCLSACVGGCIRQLGLASNCVLSRS